MNSLTLIALYSFVINEKDARKMSVCIYVFYGQQMKQTNK